MITVAIISDPPKKVFKVGISFKNINAIIIPKTGWELPIILAVLTEKYFKLPINKECPIAVVTNAKSKI